MIDVLEHDRPIILAFDSSLHVNWPSGRIDEIFFGIFSSQSRSLPQGRLSNVPCIWKKRNLRQRGERRRPEPVVAATSVARTANLRRNVTQLSEPRPEYGGIRAESLC